MSAVEIKGLKFGYGKREPLFEGLNLQFKQGHIYGLLGPNGAGKTTLLKLIIGALFPKSGQVKLWGVDAYKRNPEPLARTYFLQEEFALPPWKPSLIAELHGGFYPKFQKDKFYEVLERLGRVPEKPVSNFSRGMKQKVSIASALATNSDLLIMDEPFRGLDIPSRRELRRLIIEHATPDKAIIISTHELREVHNLIDHVVFLWSGQVLLSASTEKLSSTINIVEDVDKPLDALYSEQVAGKWRAIVPGKASQPLDLEFLFVGLTRSEQLREFFSNYKIKQS
ncbi:MAG: ABC transporter ATP-binding protein [Chlorobi bacterium]|nr:ABC transporter ATP-binding protein [Chlorobiota bacterium]